MDKIEKVLAPFANALNNNKIIQTISKALMSLMPALMIGAIGSLYNKFQFQHIKTLFNQPEFMHLLKF